MGTTDSKTSPKRVHSALQEALLDEKGLVDVLDGAAFFAEGSGEGLDTDGSAVELVDDGLEVGAVHEVESSAVDAQALQGVLCHGVIDLTGALDLREVADAPQESVDDAWGSSGPSCDLARGLGVERDVE